MHEIELKFQVPAAQRTAVDRAVAGRTGPGHEVQRRVRLQAAYFDTAQRALAKAKLALRVRREGRRRVQTLKGATADGMTRLEHNVALGPRFGAAAEPPQADPALHAGTPAGDRLFAALGHGTHGADEGIDDLAHGGARPGEPLAVLYRTDILRRTRIQRSALGKVELAFDTGSITAGEAKLAVHELEVELLAGSALAVIDVSRRWQRRFGLWLDTRNKSERGDMLARGETMAPPRTAADVDLTPRMSGVQALRCVLESCADQVLGNASQIASGEHTDEHVHQLRIGLRRLRTALQLFDRTIGSAPVSLPSLLEVSPMLAAAATTLFRRLGAARDQVVIEAGFAADLQAALQAAGVPGNGPHAPASGADEAPDAVLRDAESQGLLLDLLAATQAAHPAGSTAGSTAGTSAESSAPTPTARVASADEPDLRGQLAARLNRWHRRAAADAKRYRTLDDAGRHRLRKQVKRLRYALEFSAALFPRRAVRRYLAALRAAQERLGAINDVVVAMEAFKRSRDTDPRAWFALGWLAARREVLMAQAVPDLKKFASAKRFWKGG